MAHARTGMLGLRQQPGRIALAVFRIMAIVYRLRLGRLLGHQFLLLSHRGRKSGQIYRTVLKPISYDPVTEETVVLSMYGDSAQWLRNIEASPAVRVDTAGRSYAPAQRFLRADEAVRAIHRFRVKHPIQYGIVTKVMGWGRLASDPDLREFVSTKRFVAFAPAGSPRPDTDA